jgi:N-acetylmuramoyl-L-alanine amidase
MPGLFEELTTRYKNTHILFPTLKPVTVAQWILESGRGTSRLATEHLNFAGLKWRAEMVGFATPVAHEAHDGLDFYCKFTTLDAFIVGYWKFLSRSPYDGWEEHAAESPEAFIRFIGPIYNPAGPTYVNQILALVTEATQRLGEAPASPVILPPPAVAGTPVVIVIDPGHGGTVEVGDSSPNNAVSHSGELEKHWTLDIAKRTRAAVLAKAVTLDKNVEVVLTRETDSNKGLTARANIAQSKGAKLFLSIHFNGFDRQVRGVETLIHSININKEQDRAFAQTVQDKLVTALHQIDPSTRNLSHYNRRVKEQRLGVLNDVALGNTAAAHPCRACLVEIEFMDVPAVEQLFRLHAPQAATVEQTARNRQQVAEALAEALLTQV